MSDQARSEYRSAPAQRFRGRGRRLQPRNHFPQNSHNLATHAPNQNLQTFGNDVGVISQTLNDLRVDSHHSRDRTVYDASGQFYGQQHDVQSQLRARRSCDSRISYANNRPCNTQVLQNCDASRNPERDQENNQPRPHWRGRRRLINAQGSNASRASLANPQEESSELQNLDQKDLVENEFRSNNFECMICCDNIKRFDQIWYCESCYNIFHLKCAIEWCKKSIDSRNAAMANQQYPSLSAPPTLNSFVPSDILNAQSSSNSVNRSRMNAVEWPCPACRTVLHERPKKYKCFCGKVTNPDVNKHLTPHSCGQLCGRVRPDSNCPHTCNSLCHPGRCAPCPLTCNMSCFCGKLTKEVKCTLGRLSCDDICAKTLFCGVHNCSKRCHPGPCDTCEVMISISCHCGKKQVPKRCLEINKPEKKAKNSFSCEIVCGKSLSCQNHQCDMVCHPGPSCKPCKLLNENLKNCPCGMSKITEEQLASADRKSCLDDIPTCANKCNRALVCGPDKSRHRCQKKCHNRDCPPCKLKTTVFCKCKSSSKTVLCATMFIKHESDDGAVRFEQVPLLFDCETKCNKLKQCGRHRCYNKCCKYLENLSLHLCDQVCNKKLACGTHSCAEICHVGLCGDCPNIGWQDITCHCGSAILYPPIACGTKPPACNRPCRREHNCDHPVKHECHDDSEKCAPCTVFVKKDCFCGAESRDSVYCYQAGYSCGRTCKRKLPCEQHTCKRICHDNDCAPANDPSYKCVQPCGRPRFSCKHPCALPCHGSDPCPTTECKKVVVITCKCGNRIDSLECRKMIKQLENRNKLIMMSNRTNNGDDTLVIDLSKPNIDDMTSTSDKLGKLECDETCVLFERNKALAEALNIVQPDLKPANLFVQDPLRLLKEATLQDYKFVSNTYNSLVRFIKSIKESDKRFLFTHFPAADKLRREIIHELAYQFHCTSETQGEEPFKHVVVRGHKTKSCVPDFTVDQLLPVVDET